jgi:hypothetical protein
MLAVLSSLARLNGDPREEAGLSYRAAEGHCSAGIDGLPVCRAYSIETRWRAGLRGRLSRVSGDAQSRAHRAVMIG